MAQMKISAWAIRNPIWVSLIFIALTVAGLVAYLGLPVKAFPDISFPAVTVTITQNGAAPSELETQVTRLVEDAVAGIEGIDNIQSAVLLGSSTTTINFEIGEDEQRALDEVRTAVDQTRATLPRDIDEPLIERVKMEGTPIVTYAVSAEDMDQLQLAWFIDDTVSRVLLGESGVAQISRVGGLDREINVVVYPQRMAALGVTAPQVNEALRGFSTDVSGGRAEIGGREQTIRILGATNDVHALRALTIPLSGGRYVKLSDIADIGDGASEQRGFARLDGRPVVGFQVMKTKAASDLEVEDNVDAALAELSRTQQGIGFTKLVSTVDNTRASYTSTLETLLEGMLLAAIVVFFFLRDWRATAITAIAMPLSLIPTFAVMALGGFSLNIVTLLALTLVIGILVDDAIVEIENIQKRVQAGASPYSAAMIGADAIGLAVMATTLAIAVVFLPVSFMPGVSGQFFKEFGLTVAAAVLFSLVVARLMTPLLAAYFLKPSRDPHPIKPLPRWYQNLLGWALDHRILTVVLGTLLFIGSVALVLFIPTDFRPAGDQDFLYVELQGPPGATAADMDRGVQDATRRLLARPEVEHVFAQVGSVASSGALGGGSSGGDLRTGTLSVTLHPERELTVSEFKAQMRDSLRQIPDFRAMFQGNTGAADLKTILAGDDGAALDKAVLDLERQMRSLDAVTDVRSSSPPPGPEIVVRPKVEAARLGISAETLASVVRIATIGEIDANVAKLTDGERRLPIRIRLPVDARRDLEQLKRLQVATASGELTPLENVATIEFQAGPARIDRFDRRRQLSMQANLAPGATLGQATEQIAQLPIMQKLPAGVEPEATGDAEAMGELFASFGGAIVAGVGLVWAVMVLLFHSYFKPVTILSALPLAIGGAFLALLATGLALSLPSLIGFLMLLGLAAKNSILLVEFAIEREREGVSQRDALLHACRERARPIIMTTFAMAAGMLPTAFALGEGAEFRQPMAVAVIGGLITSTALSLVFVPVVYEFIDDIENWLMPKLGRFVTPRDPDDPAVPSHAQAGGA